MGNRAEGKGIKFYDDVLKTAFNRFKKNPSAQRQAMIEEMYRVLLLNLAVSRFKWVGLPEEIDDRFLEMTLSRYALALFYKNPDYDKFMAVKATPAGWYNVYDNPTAYQPYGNRFTSKRILAQNAVPIWANDVRLPHDLQVIGIYASKFANLDRTVEINSENARQPKIAAIPENARLSMVNFNRQLDEGTPFIQIGGGSNIQNLADMITAFDLGVNPDLIEKVHLVRTRLWNECMGLLGIENANQDKKERLVAAEVGANDDQTSMMRHVNLNARRRAADQINRKWGLDVGVAYHTDVDKINDALIDALQTGSAE